MKLLTDIVRAQSYAEAHLRAYKAVSARVFLILGWILSLLLNMLRMI